MALSIVKKFHTIVNFASENRLFKRAAISGGVADSKKEDIDSPE